MTPTKMVGLRFFLRGGGFFHVALPEPEARQIVTDWQSRDYRVRDKKTIGGTDPLGGDVWALEVDAIVGIHTFALVPQQQTPPPKPGAADWWKGTSGQQN